MLSHTWLKGWVLQASVPRIFKYGCALPLKRKEVRTANYHPLASHIHTNPLRGRVVSPSRPYGHTSILTRCSSQATLGSARSLLRLYTLGRSARAPFALDRQRHAMTGGLVEAIGRENVGAEPPTKLQKVMHAEEVPLLVKKLSEHATLPKRGSARAAGYDLAR